MLAVRYYNGLVSTVSWGDRRLSFTGYIAIWLATLMTAKCKTKPAIGLIECGNRGHYEGNKN